MERVKESLRTRAELCSLADLYGKALSNGRNDLGSLIRHGWVIRSWWTDHDAGAHKHYQLVSEPAEDFVSYQRRMRLVGAFSRKRV